MRRFKYRKIEVTTEVSTELLNTLGNEGWELVVEFNYVWIFKHGLPEKNIGGQNDNNG